MELLTPSNRQSEPSTMPREMNLVAVQQAEKRAYKASLRTT